MPIEHRKGTNYSLPSPGPYLAKIISHLDPTYMGTLEVQLMHESGNDPEAGSQSHQVKYLSPFAGQTSIRHIDDGDETYDNTQKSYGFWAVPPDVGGIVVVIFIDGDPRKGYWIGCAQDQYMNFMVPGNASTAAVVTSSKTSDAARVPTAEYNKIKNDSSVDPTKFRKPATPQEKVLETQGILKDDIRGITTSSARREIPSSVFGINTPGPVDKSGKRGKIGKAESPIDQAYVSRLGGSSFVMDDGDDKFIRKTKPSEGPPEYGAVEQGETGLKNIPHNELIRFRTRTGHQILMHNSEDLIYIGNARGTSWIELSSDGKIDIYAEDSISIHTKQDFNFFADRDINFEAGRNFNLKVKQRHQTEVGTDKLTIVNGKVAIKITGTKDEEITGATKITAKAGFDLNTTGANKFTASGATNIKSGGNHIETAAQIHMNGPSAAAASSATPPTPLPLFKNPTEVAGKNNSESGDIMLRIPSHEPWPHHENLNPVDFKPAKTDRESGSAIPVPEYWKKYSTSTDTFAKVSGADE